MTWTSAVPVQHLTTYTLSYSTHQLVALWRKGSSTERVPPSYHHHITIAALQVQSSLTASRWLALHEEMPKGSRPGIEPGTSCTQSRNHTARPSGLITYLCALCPHRRTQCLVSSTKPPQFHHFSILHPIYILPYLSSYLLTHHIVQHYIIVNLKHILETAKCMSHV